MKEHEVGREKGADGVGMTEMQRVQALERFEVIRPYVEGRVSQTEIARGASVPLRTIQRWVGSYRKEGLAGLARKGRLDRGQSRGLRKEQVMLVEGLALQSLRRPVTSIHVLVREVAQEQGWPLPSYAQVYRIVRKMPKDLETLGREGKTAYREAFDLVYRREARSANEIWQADHCQLRLFLKNEQGKVQMPLLTVIEDDYSRAIVGYRVSWSAPSALQTALTLRGAIKVKEDARWPMYGVPKCLYTDHGSDFLSKHMEAVAVDLKMALMFLQVGRPRGRGKVERFFRTVREEVLVNLPGYAPKVKEDRRMQQEIEAEAREAACLTLLEFEGIFQDWLLNTYHGRKHTETQVAPTERWCDAGVIPVLPKEERQLDLLLFQPRRRNIVHQEGITLRGAWYMHPLLAGHIGEVVIIRYDPMDLETIRVYEGGQEEGFLCEASCVERGGPAVSVQEILAERRKQQNAIGKALRERKRVVRRYASPKQLARRALEKVVEREVEEEERVTNVDTSESALCVLEPVLPKIRWYEDE